MIDPKRKFTKLDGFINNLCVEIWFDSSKAIKYVE